MSELNTPYSLDLYRGHAPSIRDKDHELVCKRVHANMADEIVKRINGYKELEQRLTAIKKESELFGQMETRLGQELSLKRLRALASGGLPKGEG